MYLEGYQKVEEEVNVLEIVTTLNKFQAVLMHLVDRDKNLKIDDMKSTFRDLQTVNLQLTQEQRQRHKQDKSEFLKFMDEKMDIARLIEEKKRDIENEIKLAIARYFVKGKAAKKRKSKRFGTDDSMMQKSFYSESQSALSPMKPQQSLAGPSNKI